MRRVNAVIVGTHLLRLMDLVLATKRISYLFTLILRSKYFPFKLLFEQKTYSERLPEGDELRIEKLFRKI